MTAHSIVSGIIGLLLISSVTKAETHTEPTVIHRTDGSEITVIIKRPSLVSAKIPILLFVDGSGCFSARWEQVQSHWKLPNWLEDKVASVIVDKPGMEPEMGAPSVCPQEFSKYYSVDQRVFDHLRVVQHLRKHADWWNGEIFLFGWSDGGAIGAHIAAYTPEVTRAVLGGMGGAIPMSKQFEDYFICAKDRMDDKQSRDECIEGLQVQFEKIRQNPTPNKSWSGSDTYKTWATRLDQMEYYLLKDLTIPYLIVHGELDRDSTPVQSARVLVDWLNRDNIKNFEYWEVPGMKHSPKSLGPVRSLLVREAMLKWLFELPTGKGGPPTFGDLESDR